MDLPDLSASLPDLSGGLPDLSVSFRELSNLRELVFVCSSPFDLPAAAVESLGLLLAGLKSSSLVSSSSGAGRRFFLLPLFNPFLLDFLDCSSPC